MLPTLLARRGEAPYVDDVSASRSLSSVSLPSKRMELLHALGAELPLLLVARGESETPIVPTFADLELLLSMEEA